MAYKREKMIQLIKSAVGGCATYWAGLIADHLISNGVRFAEDINAPSKWIPVTERLPKEDDSVLCVGNHGAVFIVKKCEEPTTDKIWINGAGWRKFTHWMPLPEPPKEDSK